MTRPARALAVLAIVAVAGCGSDATTLDRGATETAVGDAVAPELAVPVAAVTCPEVIERQVDGTFTCQVELEHDAGTVDVAVRQVDDDGALQVDPQAAVLADEELAVQARAALRDSFERSFQVDCGDGPPQVREPDTSLTCRARDADSRREITITVTDSDGTLAFEVGDPISG